MEALLDLPNLNGGLSIKRLEATVHPNVVPSILDHYLRKPAEQSIALGVLLGSIEGNNVQVKTAFSVPFSVEKDSDHQDMIMIDMEYFEKMHQFYKKVNAQEHILGFYATETELSKVILSVLGIFQEIFDRPDVKRNAIQPQPMILLVDPALKNNEMSIKIFQTCHTFIPEIPAFCEIKTDFVVKEDTGLDVLFFGQEHFDTMAIVTGKVDFSSERI